MRHKYDVCKTKTCVIFVKGNLRQNAAFRDHSYQHAECEPVTWYECTILLRVVLDLGCRGHLKIVLFISRRTTRGR